MNLKFRASCFAGGANPGAGFAPNNMGGAGQQGNPNQSSNGDDNVTDVEQANEVGFLSGACYWGSQEKEQLDAATPTFRLQTPLDLLELCPQ